MVYFPKWTEKGSKSDVNGNVDVNVGTFNLKTCLDVAELIQTAFR